MLLENWFQKKIRNHWARTNLQYLIIGLLIGTFINIIFQFVANKPREWRHILITYIISVIITLCITNISILSSRISQKKFKSPFINIILNYLLMGLGVIVGSEISYVFVALIYNLPFSEIQQWPNLKINLVLGLLVGTIIMIYQLQRDNFKLKIDEKELQLIRLNELKTQAELRTLQARINPHFLYNALNSIASLIHDDPGKAESMTMKLSQLFRYSINSQNANWTTVEEELEIVKIYLDIEQMRFGSRIQFVINADNYCKKEEMPRFLLQPLVENALKHGLKNTTHNGLLKIEINCGTDNLQIEVQDNGVPFPPDLTAGYGLQSTFDKLNLLYGEAWKLNYTNAPEKKICIQLPKKSKA